MNYSINGIEIENFKSYATLQKISISDLSVLLGANSSGKSTAIQALLSLKQTIECNNRDIELLLSGRYVALGDFDNVVYDREKDYFSIGLNFKANSNNEITNENELYNLKWVFNRSDDRFQAKLSRIEICNNGLDVVFKRMAQNRYQLFVDNEITPVIVGINNLSISGKVYLKYDKDFNRLFADFINSMKELIGGKKTTRLSMNKLVSLFIIPDFFMELLRDDSFENAIPKQDKKIEELAQALFDLVETYNGYQNPIGDEYFGMTSDMKISLLSRAIYNTGKIKEFSDIYKKYLDLFIEYKNEKKQPIERYEGEETVPAYIIKFYRKKEQSRILDTFNWVCDFYEEFEDTICNIFFIGPIRENPKGLYNIGFEQEPKYVGPTGSNFASVLLHENKIKRYILPNDEIDNITLGEALNEWAAHLNIASAVEASHATSFGIRVSVSNTQNKTADIMNVGIGTSQVLPVLISGLLSEEDEILVYEQPELHLHPYSQSRLADFFVALIKYNRRIIIETHSEAFILRLRYHILKNNCDKNAIAINFFKNHQGTSVSLCNVSGYGNIEYPDDFKDETQELLNDLMLAALKKDKK